MESEKLKKARARMLCQIKETASATASWTGRSEFSRRTMVAIESVPRHFFVPPEQKVGAYANRPQEIGHGQTISQPYIVALMTDFLDLNGRETVLEIGTGCGYQTAVISRCLQTGSVYSVEALRPLVGGANKRLLDLGCQNTNIRCGNGFEGWPEAAPFNAIIVTAAPKSVPRALVRQLKNGGRMIVPIGQPRGHQMLTLVRKDFAGQVYADKILPVAFVPMIDFG